MSEETQGITQDYESLGNKTFWLFVFMRMSPAMVFLLISIGISFLSNVDLPAKFIITGLNNVSWHYYIRIAGFASSVLFFICLGFAMLVGWLVYINYKFSLGEDSFKVKRGILYKEEIAIPYRQIQDVNIRRDPAFLIMGLSKLIIQSAGHDEKGDEAGESEGILPAIDKDMAERLQEELLKRANVQKVAPIGK
jgi:uncharacterized membrane protein YdbT with pleckstrin-like domain